MVDNPQWPAHGRVFAHLASDRSLDELHAFARRVGLHPRAFDGDHYDVPEERHAAVVAAGATLVDGRELARRLNASGLRFRKRRGDRPLARFHDVVPTAPRPHTLDLLASPVEVPERTVTAAVTFVVDALDRLLLVHHLGRDAWEAPAGSREQGESPRENAVREVREETGLVLPPERLRPVGYERLTVAEPAPRWPHVPDNHIAVYAADLNVPGPAPRAALHEVREAVWCPLDEVGARCVGTLGWPLLQHFLEHR